jgi:methionyl-tRNA formyltransferase
LIRGLSPYPAAWTYIKDGENEWNVKIYAASFEEKEHLIIWKELQLQKRDYFHCYKRWCFKN